MSGTTFHELRSTNVEPPIVVSGVTTYALERLKKFFGGDGIELSVTRTWTYADPAPAEKTTDEATDSETAGEGQES